MRLRLGLPVCNRLASGLFAFFSAVSVLALPVAAQAADAGLAALVPKYYRDKGTLTVGVNPDVAPIKFVDDDGDIVGFTPELLAAAAKELGLKMDLSKASFDAMLPGMAANRFDVLLSLSDFPSRHKAVTFVDYLDMGETVVAAPGHIGTLKSTDELCGLKVALQRGSAAMQTAMKLSGTCEKNGKKPLAISTYQDSNMTLLSVSSGASDVAWIDSPIGYYNQNRFPQKYKVVFFTPVAPYGIGFGPDDNGKQLAAAFQKALQKLQKTGVYDALLKKWGLSPKDAKPSFPINGAEL